MTKPNFQQLNRKELKKYILAHPTDDEAIRELVRNRRSPNAIRILHDTPQAEVEAILRSAIAKADNQSL
ncbi:MAG: hypothetical protein NVS2B14_08450 [Chamaesiphon sp.]